MWCYPIQCAGVYSILEEDELSVVSLRQYCGSIIGQVGGNSTLFP